MEHSIEDLEVEKWDFKINNDLKLTEQVRQLILGNKNVHIYENKMNHLNHLLLQWKSSCNSSYNEKMLDKLDKNKNITELMPPQTRLKFIKKLIRKLMKISTRFQQEANNSIYCILERQLYKNQIDAKLFEEVITVMADTINTVERLQKKVAEQAIELNDLRKIQLEKKG